MLYSEFVEGTGCRDNAYNHHIYKDVIEVAYMASDSMTKAEAYELGTKLVDHSPSETELELIAEVKAEIEVLKAEIADYKAKLSSEEDSLKYWKSEKEPMFIDVCKRWIAHCKEEIRRRRCRIATLKQWFLA